MHVDRLLLTAVLSCAGLCACATPTRGAAPAPEPAPLPVLTRTRHDFKAWPSKPPDCDFEVYEEREPSRPYLLLGTLPFTTNTWLSAAGRKRALRETACEAGADAVLLPHPEVRLMSLGRRPEEVREYSARFVVWAEGSSPEAAASPGSAQPTPEPGVVVVPVGPEWPGEAEGTATRYAPPPPH